jgi:uncharacterized phage infection (PIP) family protein YhgE
MTDQEIQNEFKKIGDEIKKINGELDTIQDQFLSFNNQLVDVIGLVNENTSNINVLNTDLVTLRNEFELFKTETENKIKALEENMEYVLKTLNEEVMPEIALLQDVPESLSPIGGSDADLSNLEGVEFKELEPEDVIKSNLEITGMNLDML